MRAIGLTRGGEATVLEDLELPTPVPTPRDLLVEVRAVSVNPVDTKVRRNDPADGRPKVLGWDVAGVVREVGPEVTLFKPGDAVWYAGSIIRPGANSELHVVDERIVASKPATLDFASAAALPLTAITAWELLFERLGVERNGGAGKSLLVVGAAGGVGSILVQLASKLTQLRVIGTASRAETATWVKELGADEVIDHAQDLRSELARLGIDSVDLVAALTHTDQHFPALADVVSPQGKVGAIDDPGAVDIGLLKSKAASFHWEFMFTRSMYDTDDMIEQHRLLSEVSTLVDQGVLRSTLGESYGEISASSLRRAHQHIESGRARGKVVLSGWSALT